MKKQTPWGTAQDSHTIAEGITFYSTAGHGGIQLSNERWKELKSILPTFEPFCGAPGWLEEDCDYFYAMFCWPEHWDDYAVWQLSNMIEGGRWLPEINKDASQYRIVCERAQKWQSENTENWVRGSMGSGRGTPRGLWWVWFNRVSDNQRREVRMEYPEKIVYTTEELDAFDEQFAELVHAQATDF